MIELSFAGLAGAFIGIVVAALAYGPLVRALERSVRSGGRSDENDAPEIALLRRAVFAADILLFAGVGYWLAVTLAG